MLMRSAQLDAFLQNASRGFEDRMVTHLRKCFQSRCEVLGEHGLRETIRFGVQRASTYGITAERDVCKYIDVMIVFGRDFDTKTEELPWATRILNDKLYKDSTARVEALFDAAREV